jgi:scyllo-inositol 2-dehydrogenase (NADP+)
MALKIGIVGFGKSAQQIHMPLINQTGGVDVVGIYSRQPRELLFLKSYQSYERLLQDSNVDIVVITTPNFLHYEHVKLALMSNKHVIVEKPAGYSSKMLNELSMLACERGLCLAVFYNRVYDSDFLTLQKIISHGFVGSIKKLEYQFFRYHPCVGTKWKDQDYLGSGVLYDLGSHMIHQMLTIFGSLDLTVAEIYRQREHATVCDSFSLILKSKAITIDLHTDSMIKGSGKRFLAEGDMGSVEIHGDCAQELFLKEHRSLDDIDPQQYVNATLSDSTINNTEITVERGDWRRFYAKFINLIQLGKTFSNINEIATLDLIESAYGKSLNKKGSNPHHTNNLI